MFHYRMKPCALFVLNMLINCGHLFGVLYYTRKGSVFLFPFYLATGLLESLSFVDKLRGNVGLLETAVPAALT